jgi:hypothetical protein
MLKSALTFLLLATIAALPHLATAQLYDVRTSSVNYERHERTALKVQVDGTAADTRSYFQDWMKDSYNVRFKNGGIAGFGKSATLTAKQTSASTISGKLINLYATVIAPTDSTAEVQVFGGFDDNTFFDETHSTSEFSALRSLTQNFAAAARLKAYREMIAAAEKQLRESEKEKDKLERSVQQRKASTASNLSRMEELKKQNIENALQVRQDSVQLLRNVDVRKANELRLQRRRDRLSALDRKN